MPLSQPDIMRILFAARVRLSAGIWVVVREAQTAEDIFQNVAVKALNRDLVFEHEAEVLSWAQVTARREALDWVRRYRNRWVTVEDSVLELLEADWSQPTAAVGGRVQALEECLAKMPDRERNLIEWRYYEGCSCGEVALRAGLSLDAVYQRLSRLHRQLKVCIERRLTGEPGAEPNPSTA